MSAKITDLTHAADNRPGFRSRTLCDRERHTKRRTLKIAQGDDAPSCIDCFSKWSVLP